MDNQLLYNALGSATAGIISRVFTHPLDTAKAIMQSSDATTLRGPLDAIQKTYGREGLTGLYRGFGAVIIGGTPGTIVYLCSYDFFKRFLGDGDPISSSSLRSFSVHFASGMLAESVACIVYVPVDVVKERLQVQALSSRVITTTAATNECSPYKGSWDAFKTILRAEHLSGIYKGYGATLASFGPFSAFYFVFYEQFKHYARGNTTASTNTYREDIPLPLLVACSASAGALASWITSPLDMAKLRLQVQRGRIAASGNTGTQIYYKNMLDCLVQTFSKDGLRGLFRGAGARVLHFAPATTITMTCYEKCRLFYSNLLSPDHH